MSRRGRRWPIHLLTVSLTGTVLAFAAAPLSPLTARASGLSFTNSAVEGGGFISVLAQSPTGTVIAGGDTEGFFRSVDAGATWTPQDQGLPAAAYSVAALLDQGGTWYAAVGTGSNGGIATSVDDGVSWAYHGHAGAGTPPTFDGSNLPGQQGQPRATGDLLASDGTYLYAASFGRGLERWPLELGEPGRGLAVRGPLHLVPQLDGPRRQRRRLRLGDQQDRREQGRVRGQRPGARARRPGR